MLGEGKVRRAGYAESRFRRAQDSSLNSVAAARCGGLWMTKLRGKLTTNADIGRRVFSGDRRGRYWADRDYGGDFRHLLLLAHHAAAAPAKEVAGDANQDLVWRQSRHQRRPDRHGFVGQG